MTHEAELVPLPPIIKQCTCGGEAPFDRGCAAYVCLECGHHDGMCRCWCGWSTSGADGYRELIECGETIEEET